MKIILSRKGFDSGYGGVASPVLPDGRILSLPIPSVAGIALGKCHAEGLDFAGLVSDLTAKAMGPQSSVHLDPDLSSESLPRATGWRPAFGQVGSAQGHLANNGVGRGDLFLFFGWFQHTDLTDAGWRHRKGNGFHSLFGWLLVDEVIDVDEGMETGLHPSLSDHPHVRHARRFFGQQNTLYMGSERLGLSRHVVSGAGAFRRWTPRLRLTDEGERLRTNWAVPGWLHPTPDRPALTYHGNPDRWARDGDRALLKSVAKGQEFVLDTEHYPEAIDWVASLIQEHA